MYFIKYSKSCYCQLSSYFILKFSFKYIIHTWTFICVYVCVCTHTYLFKCQLLPAFGITLKKMIQNILYTQSIGRTSLGKRAILWERTIRHFGMHTFMIVCTGMHLYCWWDSQQTASIGSPCLPRCLRWDLSLFAFACTRIVGLWACRDSPGCLPSCRSTGITVTHNWQAFTWMLGIWPQALMFARQTLCSLNHLSSSHSVLCTIFYTEAVVEFLLLW